jgi:hypothetical protein
MTTNQLVHPDLSLPVRRIHLLVACTTFLEDVTLPESVSEISISVNIDNFDVL